MASASRESSTTASTRERLGSNVMNYLVWRYLQEAGFAMAAEWLSKEWHLHPDEVMPFYRHVKQNQLIHMVQDALFMDDIRARGSRDKHRYFFGDDHGPLYAVPTYDIAGERKPGDVPRAQSSTPNGVNGTSESSASRKNKQKERANSHRPVNGDAMDLDENGYGPSEQASEVDSPAPAVQEVEPLLNTLTITDSSVVAAEKPLEILSSSTILPWPDSFPIARSDWSPVQQNALMVAGSNTLRLFGIKTPEDQVQALDIELAGNTFEIGALCWTGEASAAIAITESLDGESSEIESGKLVHVTNWGHESDVFDSMTGTVFALRYNPEAKLLLSLSGGTATTISIYKQSSSGFSLLCAKDLEGTSLYDTVWMNETQFIACGTNILQICEIVDAVITVKQKQEMKKSWFQIKYDPVCDIAAFVDEKMTALRQYNVGSEDTKTQSFTNTQITDFEFQPLSNDSSVAEAGGRRLLATSTDDGVVQLWDVLQPFTCVHRLQVYGEGSVYLNKIAWSPDGVWLAGAGIETVAIWNTTDEGSQAKALWQCKDEDRWKSPPDGESGWVHDLKWDLKGEKLVYSLHDQAVVVRLP
ncbi:hypothetical protein BT63DRAFT_281691 [Microthyrium microscopicum]|uniref:WD40 repeat-like protein n=1 Tax=Microthyrium microscopicum TaxID=703497 RepID=A0A6A6UCG8_9PEZI|nr:hypothetical protein BT63DRAFT_281691 [Microthyrium microscopicum]